MPSTSLRMLMNNRNRPPRTPPMSALERRAVAAIAGTIVLRMFGLFLVLPVLALYAAQLPGATPLLIGLTLGVAGLTQALFQLPLGAASDRVGRRVVITAGLLLFAVGGAVAASADDIVGLILGRAAQGAGAISAAALAWLADSTADANRGKAMGAVGVGIGAMFVLSLMLAPPLAGVIGVAGIFWLGAALALPGIILVWRVAPAPPPARPGKLAWRATLDAQLAQPYLGAFCLHAVLTAMFVVLPGLLQSRGGLPPPAHWKVYLPVLALSAPLMIPWLIASNKHLRASLLIGVAMLFATTLALALGQSWRGLVAALWLFFVAFNALEASLPSLASRLARPSVKGATMGVYGTCQFLGLFVGGVGGGYLAGQFGASGVFGGCAALCAAWLIAWWRAPKIIAHRPQ